MDQKFSAVISGAGSGVGRGLCLALAAEGHAVFATDRDIAAARETVALLPEGATASAVALDVASQSQIDAFAQQLADENVGLLINNAGLQHVASLESFPPEKWELLIDVMLNGACRLTRALLPAMRRRGFGRIVNIGSIHSLVASPYKSAYVAAKHGLLGFSKAVALETGDVDITINTICPSYIKTPLVEAQIASQAQSHGITEAEVVDTIMLQPMPKRAFITIDEIAAAILFLASSQARNITGTTITIDGGWTAR